MLALLTAAACGEKYVVFTSASNSIGSYEYTSEGAETVSFYTPVSRFIVIMNRYDPSKVSYTVSSPTIKSESPDPPVFHFRNGNAKITVTFHEPTTVSFGFAGIPSSQCENITVISKHEFTHTEAVTTSTEKCWLFAPASAHASYKVTDNQLTTQMRLALYHMTINDNAYDSFGGDGRTSTQWEGNSATPWLFRLSTTASVTGSGSITFQGRAEKPEGVPDSDLVAIEAAPFKFQERAVGAIENQWWIPVIGCAAPIFLLVAWSVGVYRVHKQSSSGS